METTPMIPIDDAYIGICMLKAGFTDYIFNDGRFRSWGLERKADVKIYNFNIIFLILFIFLASKVYVDFFI